MGCASCASKRNSSPRGCKSNGTCGTDSCNKLTVFDWLGNMEMPSGKAPFSMVEVRFKNSRKEFFTLPEGLRVTVGEPVITHVENGYDLGLVTLTGELVRFQMKKKKVSKDIEEGGKILRQANQQQTDKWHTLRDTEAKIHKRARELTTELS